MTDPTLSQTPSSPFGIPRQLELRVIFSFGAATPARVVLSGGPVSIGREVDAGGIRLDDRRVSRVHVIVQREGDQWMAVDQGSRNGVFVDGEQVTRASLAPGSVVRVGGALLLFTEREVRDEIGGPGALAGESLAMRGVRSEIRMAAPGAGPVLITGETGVGKELVAEELHRLSGRGGAFVPINCAAINAAVAESELFGHVAGAFTGAARRGEGLWAAAAGGTLFLDEIGELAPELQAKLLRTLALGEVRPVGATRATTVDVQVVAATNRDLDADVAAGRFRADLLARLAAWRIEVPPLRARRDDILALAQLFLASAKSPLSLTADAAEALVLFGWPWNVRELKQVIEGGITRSAAQGADVLGLEHLPPNMQQPLIRRLPPTGAAPGEAPAGAPPAELDAAPAIGELTRLLIHHGCNVSAVARIFGKERRQVYRWIERYDIDLDELRRRP